MTADIIALANQYGRYGYRRITALLRDAGWAMNVKRVERIWRRATSRSGDRTGTAADQNECLCAAEVVPLAADWLDIRFKLVSGCKTYE